jgi:hypothetical protein
VAKPQAHPTTGALRAAVQEGPPAEQLCSRPLRRLGVPGERCRLRLSLRLPKVVRPLGVLRVVARQLVVRQAAAAAAMGFPEGPAARLTPKTRGPRVTEITLLDQTTRSIPI